MQRGAGANGGGASQALGPAFAADLFSQTHGGRSKRSGATTNLHDGSHRSAKGSNTTDQDITATFLAASAAKSNRDFLLTTEGPKSPTGQQ